MASQVQIGSKDHRGKQAFARRVKSEPQDFDYSIASTLLNGDGIDAWMADKASKPLDKGSATREQILRLRRALRRLGNPGVRTDLDSWGGLGDDVAAFQGSGKLEDRVKRLAGDKPLTLAKTGAFDRLTVALIDLGLVEECETPNAQVVCSFKSCALAGGPLGDWMGQTKSDPLNQGNATPEQVKAIRLALFWWGDTAVANKDSWGQLGDDVVKFQKAQLKEKDRLKNALQFLQVEGDESVLRPTGEVDRLTAALLDLALFSAVEDPDKLTAPPVYPDEARKGLDLMGDDPRVLHLQHCLIALGYTTEDELGDERQRGARDRDQTALALIDFQYDWDAGGDGKFGPGTAHKMTAALQKKDGVLPRPPEMPAEGSDGKPQPLNYPGGPDYQYTDGHGNEHTVQNHAGPVRFVDTVRPAIAGTWNMIVCPIHSHYDPPHNADVNRHGSGYPAGEMEVVEGNSIVQVRGPGAPFRVARRFIGEGLGGVVCAIVRDRNVRILFGHLTEISADVYRAARDGTELPAGTFLGVTKDLIGLTTGQHLHLQANVLGGDHAGAKMTRSEFLPRLREQQNSLSTDDPQS